MGGISVVFIYMSRIASNEKFYFSIKLLVLNVLIIIFLTSINFNNFNNQNLILLINLCNDYSSFIINKLYVLPSGNITLIIIIYLLFTLIVVSNIIKIKYIPLRRN